MSSVIWHSSDLQIFSEWYGALIIHLYWQVFGFCSLIWVAAILGTKQIGYYNKHDVSRQISTQDTQKVTYSAALSI